eukprot:UN01778
MTSPISLLRIMDVMDIMDIGQYFPMKQNLLTHMDMVTIYSMHLGVYFILVMIIISLKFLELSDNFLMMRYYLHSKYLLSKAIQIFILSQQ